MFKKVFITISILLFSLNTWVFAWWAAEVNCVWLPGCVDKELHDPSPADISNNLWLEIITSLIWEAIQFVALIAVIALIISGIMYLVSWWDDEKANKAKRWITWSLVWVIISISAWWIINMLNKFTIW